MSTRSRIAALLICALALAACSTEPPRTASGRKLKLETIRHPYRETTYLYRPAD